MRRILGGGRSLSSFRDGIWHRCCAALRAPIGGRKIALPAWGKGVSDRVLDLTVGPRGAHDASTPEMSLQVERYVRKPPGQTSLTAVEGGAPERGRGRREVERTTLNPLLNEKTSAGGGHTAGANRKVSHDWFLGAAMANENLSLGAAKSVLLGPRQGPRCQSGHPTALPVPHRTTRQDSVESSDLDSAVSFLQESLKAVIVWCSACRPHNAH